MIFFDLDHFKEVNDTHGHLRGSQVLKEVAVIVEDVFLNSGAASAGYGEDEFVILLPGYSLEKSNDYGEALRDAIEKNVFIKEGPSQGDPPLNIKGVITCGVATASLEKGNDPKKMQATLIRAADTALYRTKDLGKNLVSLNGTLEAAG